jgi:hypothetical protein
VVTQFRYFRALGVGYCTRSKIPLHEHGIQTLFELEADIFQQPCVTKPEAPVQADRWH